MSKYQPLSARLAASPEDEWRASFSELEAVLGFPLPKAARSSRAWWGNDPDKSHSRAWAAHGWEVGDVDHAAERVVFRRGAASGATLAAAAHLQPLKDAEALEGLPPAPPAPAPAPAAAPAAGDVQPPAMKAAAETASARMRANRAVGGAALAAAAAAVVTGLGAWALRRVRRG